MPHQNSGVKYENSSIYMASKSCFFLVDLSNRKHKPVTGDVFVDGYDWCWCCFCACLVPLFGRIPGPQDIKWFKMIGWWLSIWGWLKKMSDVKRFDCSPNLIALLRMRLYTSSTMANVWVSTPWTEIRGSQIIGCVPFGSHKKLHQHLVWDNSQSWTTVDICIFDFNHMVFCFPKKLLASWKNPSSKCVESSKELEFESRKLLARKVKHSRWGKLVWIEGACWQNFCSHRLADFLLIILKSRLDTKDILIFQKLHVGRIHVRLPGFSCCFFQTSNCAMILWRLLTNCTQSPSKVWFHQCCAA